MIPPVRCRGDCRDGCRFGCRGKKPVRAEIACKIRLFSLFIFIPATKTTKITKKKQKVKITGRILFGRFLQSGCRSLLPEPDASSPLPGSFYSWREMPMAEKKGKQEQEKKVQFIVRREFAGGQTMRDAFEGLIERQTCERFEEWLGQKAG